MAIIKLNNNALTSVTELPSGVGADPNVKTDLARLGLRVFANQNLVATNSNSASYDVFQDDSGIGTETNTDRNDSEYVSSVTTSESAFSDDGSTDMLLHMNDTGLTDSAGNIGAPSLSGNTTRSSAQSKFGGYSASFDGSGDELDYPDHAKFNYSTNDFTMEFWVWLNAVNTTYCIISGRESANNRYHVYINSSGNVEIVSVQGGSTAVDCIAPYTFVANTWTHVAITRASGVIKIFVNGTNISLTTNTTPNGIINNHSGSMDFGYRTDGYYYLNGYLDEVRFSDVARYSANFTPNAVTVTSATGNFISNPITASSTSKMGAVITYTDASGTNALNSDLVLQLSADNGSNFSTATLTALPDFASGVKCCKVSDLSVTAGTQLKYKISFANQSSGSKECRVTGVSLQY